MKKTTLEKYALLICFVATISIAISIILIIYNVVGVIKPNITMNSYEYAIHVDNDRFWDHETERMEATEQRPPKQRPAEQELTKMRTESYQRVINVNRHGHSHNLMGASITIIISLLLFFIHWKFILYKHKEE